MQKPHSKILITLVLAGIAVCLAVILFSRWHLPGTPPDAAYLSLLREASTAVTSKYVEKPDQKKLAQGMLDGMLASLDPHSAYLPPEPYREMEVQMAGAFGGVGIELGMKDGKLTVIAPIEDTPAFRAGIQAGDHIWKIDGTVTRGMTISTAIKLMRGQKGTPVTLSILRNGSPRLLTFRLTRDIIRIKSLRFRQLEPGYGFIRIAQFQERTGSEFREALQALHAAAGGKLKGLVIDLRYNPGGLLEAAIDVANCFIGDDAGQTLIVSTKGRVAEANQAYEATLGAKEPRYPIVVLMNGGSASASEIVAGALQDHKRAIIMGKQSFGKGSVQSIFTLPGNGALKLTTALYYTPNGRSIQAKGITPDIEVAAIRPVARKEGELESIREKDLEKRLAPDDAGKVEGEKKKEKEKEKGQEKGQPETPHGGMGEPDTARDYQLSRALELLRSLSLLRDRGVIKGPR